jgi:NTP pyrophosphatase (non-canonical NTP hydrolase)
MNDLCKGLNESAQVIFENNKAKGFWDKPRNVGEMLMLVVTELAEALEAHRKDKFSNWNWEQTPTREEFSAEVKDTFEDEIADAMIRLLDLSAGMGINIEQHIQEKVKYNAGRPHMHGKTY